MQKFDGEGIVFVELDGSTIEYNLQAGEQLVLDTGHLAICLLYTSTPSANRRK